MIPKTILVVDSGMFFSFAERMARDGFKRVLFWSPDYSSSPTPNTHVIGDGFEGIERVKNFWESAHEADIVSFPDIGMSDLQLELVRQGKPVWGSRTADQLEMRRAAFKELQADLGMAVPPHEIVHGLTALREFLSDHGPCFIKISRYRGLAETFHFVNMKLAGPWLDVLAVKLGPIQDHLPFVVEDPIDSIVETGLDTFGIDGQFPKVACQGNEQKDRSMIMTVTPWDELPQELIECHEAMAPELAKHQARNFFHSEVRITGEGEAFFIDPTCRAATPGGECLYALIKNLPEIVEAGANGELIEPIYAAKFAVQVLIEHTGDERYWRTLQVPEKIRHLVTLYTPVGLGNDIFALPPLPSSSDSVGSIVAVGNSISEAIEVIKYCEKELEGQSLDIHIEALTDGLKSIQKQEEQDIPFTKEKVPEPESVVGD